MNGQTWFVAKDVCDRLGLTNSRKALKPLDDDEKGVTSSYTPGGVQRVSIVNESGLYSLVFQSRKPDAPGAPGGQWAQVPAGRSVGQASKMRSGWFRGGWKREKRQARPAPPGATRCELRRDESRLYEGRGRPAPKGPAGANLLENEIFLKKSVRGRTRYRNLFAGWCRRPTETR